LHQHIKIIKKKFKNIIAALCSHYSHPRSKEFFTDKRELAGQDKTKQKYTENRVHILEDQIISCTAD
jgi:hypothetical protein